MPMRPDRTTVSVYGTTAEHVDEFRRELENILRRRVSMNDVIGYAVTYALGNAEKIIQHELEPA